jgi:3-phenylpropionate/cinnamic acid dioxygenase small subunit
MGSLTRSDAEDFLYHEARLLDERRYEEWLDLFTGDARYWVPYKNDVEPYRETPVIYDDRPTMEDRVYRLRSPAAHAQSPASRTVHLVGNVMVENNAADAALLRSSFVIHEARSDKYRSLAGLYEHHMRFEEGQWRIALKKIWLINRDQPIFNLTFLL